MANSDYGNFCKSDDSTVVLAIVREYVLQLLCFKEVKELKSKLKT